jgi:vancomycin resistance protein YoaR
MGNAQAISAEELHASHSGGANRLFWLKSRLLIAGRMLKSALAGEYFHRYSRLPNVPAGARLLAEDEHRLYSSSDPRERDLELGKVQNLRVAAASIDGIVVKPGETFSFWLAAGRPRQRNGYVAGREMRGGCLIPSVGGGICQLTNALSRVAHAADMEIIERHSHTVHPTGFFIDDATDATVFWNYVDLRFRASMRTRIGAELTESTLVVRLDAIP